MNWSHCGLVWCAAVALWSTEVPSAKAFLSTVFQSTSVHSKTQHSAKKSARTWCDLAISRFSHGGFAKKTGISFAKESETEGKEHNQNSVVVTLKMAFDKLWAVADEEKAERFTSPASLDMVHRLRRISDCVLVGRSTVESDNCSLTVRRVPLDGQQPTRVVLDPRLSLLLANQTEYAIFNDGYPTIIYHAQSDTSIFPSVNKDFVTLVSLPNLTSQNGDEEFTCYLSPTAVVEDLKRRGLTNIMVEGGPAAARAFLSEGIVDRAIIVRPPVTFARPVPSFMSQETLQSAGLVKLGTATDEFEGDAVDYWARPGQSWPSENLAAWP